MIDVDAQDFSEQHIDVLRIVRRIVAGSAVADPDVQVAVGTECQHSPVVIGVGGMRNRQQDFFGGAGDIAIGGYAVFRDDQRAVARAGVVNEEPAVARVGGV